MRVTNLIAMGICGGVLHVGACAWMQRFLQMTDAHTESDPDNEKKNLCKKDFMLRHRTAMRAVFAMYGMLMAVGLAVCIGCNAEMLTVLAFFSVLSILTLIDAVRRVIPFELNVLLFGIGVVSVFTIPETGIASRLVGMVCISLPMLLLTLFVPGGFGGGDIKLMTAAGMMLGAERMMLAFFIGLVAGGAYGFFSMIRCKMSRKGRLAFGPWLSLGLMIALLYGRSL